MAESEIPRMDWRATNIPDAFSLYKQKMGIYLRIKGIVDKALQVDYILAGSGDEGIRRFNTWGLSEDKGKDPATVWRKFTVQLVGGGATKPNFRVARLKLHHYQQRSTETLDEFVTKCKEQADQCQFEDDEKAERIIELIAASTHIYDFQEYLFDQPKYVDLETILERGREYEARIRDQKGIRTPMPGQAVRPAGPAVAQMVPGAGPVPAQRPSYKYAPTVRNPQHPGMAPQQPAQQVPQQAVVVQGQKPLTATELAAAQPQEQKQMLGERLFPLISDVFPDLAGKITGMLLEIDNSELLHMLEYKESLTSKVEEAVAVLNAHQAKEAEK